MNECTEIEIDNLMDRRKKLLRDIEQIERLIMGRYDSLIEDLERIAECERRAEENNLDWTELRTKNSPYGATIYLLYKSGQITKEQALKLDDVPMQPESANGIYESIDNAFRDR